MPDMRSIPEKCSYYPHRVLGSASVRIDVRSVNNGQYRRIRRTTKWSSPMAEVLLFHHAQGLTSGVREFARRLEGAGHIVHFPDLYDGNVFATLNEGMVYARSVGFDVQLERGRSAAENLPAALAYIGFSLGVMPAQLLAQTRPGATGAVLLHGCLPVSEFGEAWPDAVPVQIHGMDADEWFVDGGDLEAAEEIVASASDAELFLYAGSDHLFTDRSLPAFNADAAELVTERVLTFLARLA